MILLTNVLKVSIEWFWKPYHFFRKSMLLYFKGNKSTVTLLFSKNFEQLHLFHKKIEFLLIEIGMSFYSYLEKPEINVTNAIFLSKILFFNIFGSSNAEH